MGTLGGKGRKCQPHRQVSGSNLGGLRRFHWKGDILTRELARRWEDTWRKPLGGGRSRYKGPEAGS